VYYRCYHSIEQVFAAGTVSYYAGPTMDATDTSGVDATTVDLLAGDADYIVVCVGEGTYAEKPGDIDDLALPQVGGGGVLLTAPTSNASTSISTSISFFCFSSNICFCSCFCSCSCSYSCSYVCFCFCSCVCFCSLFLYRYIIFCMCGLRRAKWSTYNPWLHTESPSSW
jgi:hypothetical protein